MIEITKEQYEELCEAHTFNEEEFRRLLSEYCDIESKPYTVYSYYDAAGDYIGSSNDEHDVKGLLDNAYISVR